MSDIEAEGFMQLGFARENVELRQALRLLLAAVKEQPTALGTTHATARAVAHAEEVLVKYEQENVAAGHGPRVKHLGYRIDGLPVSVVTEDDGDPE